MYIPIFEYFWMITKQTIMNKASIKSNSRETTIKPNSAVNYVLKGASTCEQT